MKRRPVMLALALLLLLPALQAVPAGAPYGTDLMVWYNELEPREMAIYDAIYEGVTNFETEIELPKGTCLDEVDLIMGLVMDDSPELFWMSHEWSTIYYDDRPDIAVAVEVDYTMSEDDAVTHLDLISEYIDAIRLPGNSILETEMILHDLLAYTTDYVDSDHAYDITGPLVYGQAVCEGYAKAFAFLLRLAGIPAGVIGGVGTSDGEEELHAWNIVKIGDDWTLVDLTWNDEEDESTYDWFNLSDEMFASTHEPELVPSFYYDASDSWDINRLLGNYVNGNAEGEFFRRLDNMLQTGEDVSMYFVSRREYKNFLRHWEDMLDDYNEDRGERGLWTEFFFFSDDDRMSFHLSLD